MKFRLLQARVHDDPVREEERAAFAQRLQVPIAQVETFDLLSGATEFNRITDGVDAVLVGGSGDFSIYYDHAWLKPFIDTLGELADQQFPTFASCFGFQGMVVALGGHVASDEPAAEVGTFEIELLQAGVDDPLFDGLPSRFDAQLGHKDRALRMPSGVTNLAQSARCPYQAMRIGAGHVYATQFHPELTGDDNLGRFNRYLDLYSHVLGADRVVEMVSGFSPSPHTEGLLKRFADMVDNE
jgi:GMP synthase (glutamine-hydrolysing)